MMNIIRRRSGFYCDSDAVYSFLLYLLTYLLKQWKEINAELNLLFVRNYFSVIND